MSIVFLRGSSLEDKIRVFFFIKPPLKSSPNEKKSTLIQERGNIPTQIYPQILKPLLCRFFEKLCNFRQRCYKCAPSTWISPTNTCPTKYSNSRCLGYVAFKCHANFHINWESCAHRNQQRNMYRI